MSSCSRAAKALPEASLTLASPEAFGRAGCLLLSGLCFPIEPLIPNDISKGPRHRGIPTNTRSQAGAVPCRSLYVVIVPKDTESFL